MIQIKEEFKYRLERALSIREIKPADLARATDISEATISQYRSGYSKPKDTRLVKIANYLRVDPSWLMGLDVPMESSPAAAPSLSQEETAIALAYREADEGTKNSVAKLLDVKRAGSDSDSVINNVG